MMRKRRARKKETARRKAELDAIQKRFSAGAKDAGDHAFVEEEDAETVAQRLNRQLAQAEQQGVVADTDPRAVAARLARELANENGGEQT